jgi:aminoglycoside phosphotransferase (APT) family kinase protein
MEIMKQPLEAYLRFRFGPDAVLVKQERFPRGSSRLTYFVDFRLTPEAPVTSLVFRADFAGGSIIHSSLEQEYYMYERLGHTAVPVARVLRWEDDPDWAERPFFIREQVEGHWDVPHFKDPDPQYDALRIAISKEHMRKLALVHQVDWRSLGLDTRLPPPANNEQAAHHFIDAMVARLAQYQREPMPVVIEALVAFRRTAPVAPAICLCKGTNGLGEEVFRDGVIVAMSDWEEASIGDPAADFASLQDLIPEIERDGTKLWGLGHAVAYYREVSGIGVTVENVRFYQQLRTFGAVLYSHKAAVVIHDGHADIRHGWTGTEVFYLAKRMVAAVAGISPPVDPKWFAEMNETII